MCCCLSLIYFLAQIAFPVYKSVELAKENEVNSKETQTYILYWIFFLMLQMVNFLTCGILEYIPFFQIVQTLFCVWLIHPEYKGSLYVYHKWIKKNFEMVQEKIVKKE